MMEILTRTRCTACGGEGAVPDPTGFWQAFTEWWNDYKTMYGGEDPPPALREAFALGRGLDPATLPPDLPSCSACGGSGYVERWAEVDPFLAAMILSPACDQAPRDAALWGSPARCPQCGLAAAPPRLETLPAVLQQTEDRALLQCRACGRRWAEEITTEGRCDNT